MHKWPKLCAPLLYKHKSAYNTRHHYTTISQTTECADNDWKIKWSVYAVRHNWRKLHQPAQHKRTSMPATQRRCDAALSSRGTFVGGTMLMAPHGANSWSETALHNPSMPVREDDYGSWLRRPSRMTGYIGWLRILVMLAPRETSYASWLQREVSLPGYYY